MRSTLLGIRLLLASVASVLAIAGQAGAATTVTSRSPDTPTASGPGMYHVYSCHTPAGAMAPIDGWTGSTYSACAPGSGSFGISLGTGSGSTLEGDSMQWKPAAGLRGVSLELRRALTVSTSGPESAWSFLHLRSGSAETSYDSIESNGAPAGSIGDESDAGAAANRQVIDPLPAAGQRDTAPIVVTAECELWSNGYPQCVARYRIFRADFRMLDATSPTASVGGGLVTATRPDRPAQSGAVPFQVQAADVGAGLLDVAVEIDGTVVSRVSLAGSSTTCRPTSTPDGLSAYLVQVPCPLAASATGSWDTTKVGNGLHQMRLLVQDAAGNVAVVLGGTVLVDNPVGGGGASGGGDAAGGGTANGFVGSGNTPAAGVDARLSLVWPGTAVAASKRPSVVKRCRGASYAKKHPLACVGRPAQSSLKHDYDVKAKDTLYGVLTTVDGQPIQASKLELTWQPAAVGAAPVTLPPAWTDNAGLARIEVPSGQSSGTYTLAWRARSGDAAPAAQATATLDVAAATIFKAPTRVRPSAKVTFSGTLRGPAGLLADVTVTLQVFNQGQWKTFETATSDARGRWSARLTFAPRRGIYPVRVKVEKSPTFPFTPGVAASARVRVS